MNVRDGTYEGQRRFSPGRTRPCMSGWLYTSRARPAPFVRSWVPLRRFSIPSPSVLERQRSAEATISLSAEQIRLSTNQRKNSPTATSSALKSSTRRR